MGWDRNKTPVIDPTANVIALVEAGLKRQDDLRDLAAKHATELMVVRISYEDKLRVAESARINAIRDVDVQAAALASNVQSQVAATLASQTTTLADALRANVATVAQAAQGNLTAALAPMQKAIDDLRAVQYAQQGQQAAKTENKDSGQWVITTIISAAAILSSIILVVGGSIIGYFVTHH
jgi:hypothetical protein